MATGTLTRPRQNPGRSRSARSSTPLRPARRRHWLRWGVLVLVLALIGGAVWLLGFSSVYATDRVAVSGESVLSEDQVQEAAAVPIGLPLARQDLDVVADRVARLAPVERVTVDRVWPDAVQIHVTERTALLAVKQGGGYALVDRHGVAFDEALQVPSGVALAEAELSQTDQLVEIGAVARSLPEDVRATITKISASSASQLTLTLASGVTVTWGSADQTKLKGEIVTALLERKPKAIDVSSPANPAIR